MKLLPIYAALLLFTLGCGQKDKSENKDESTTDTAENSSEEKRNDSGVKHIFDIKAAKIVFNFTGGPETGTQTLYFDDYGEVAVLVVDKKTEYYNIDQTIIWKEGKSTIIDHEKKTVSSSS